MPLYQLLGGASRDRASRPTGTRAARDLPELLDSVRAHLDEGFRADPRAVRRARAWRRSTASPRRPGPTTTRDCASRRGDAGTPRAYLRHLPTVFEAVRNEFGPELPLLHDVHHRLTPIQAAKLGQGARALRPVLAGGLHAGREPGGPAPGPPAHHDPARHRRGLQHGLRLPDADPRAAHRLRPLRRDPHRRDHRACASSSTSPRSTRSSPASTARPTSPPSAWPPALHLDLGDPQLRHPGVHAAQRGDLRGVPPLLHVQDGFLHPGDTPGLGVTVDEEAAAKFQYRPAYLPVNRLRDGTVHDW